MDTTYLTVRCRAFRGEGVRRNRIRVSPDGTIRVYDSVAACYTLCHSLCRSAQARIRRLAAATQTN
jgi:hypothetical protein